MFLGNADQFDLRVLGQGGQKALDVAVFKAGDGH
jgi:hypothetical protein